MHARQASAKSALLHLCVTQQPHFVCCCIHRLACAMAGLWTSPSRRNARAAAMQGSQQQRRMSSSRIHCGRTLCWTHLGERAPSPPQHLSNLWEAWPRPCLPIWGQGLMISLGALLRGPQGVGEPCRQDWRRPHPARMQCSSAQRSLWGIFRRTGSQARPLSRTPSSEAPTLLSRSLNWCFSAATWQWLKPLRVSGTGCSCKSSMYTRLTSPRHLGSECRER